MCPLRVVIVGASLLLAACMLYFGLDSSAPIGLISPQPPSPRKEVRNMNHGDSKKMLLDHHVTSILCAIADASKVIAQICTGLLDGTVPAQHSWWAVSSQIMA